MPGLHHEVVTGKDNAMTMAAPGPSELYLTIPQASMEFLVGCCRKCWKMRGQQFQAKSRGGLTTSLAQRPIREQK